MEFIEEIIACHFDDRFGSLYWLEVKNNLPFDPCQEIRSREALHLLGPMDVEALRHRPLLDFIPKRFHQDLPRLILSETGGTTGPPCRRVFLPEEFDRAFLDPWERVVDKRGFPRGGQWLFIGPSGPHVIGQAARAMSRRIGSLECFSVDCDVRWFRKQAPNSLGAILYLDHVLDQAMNIMATQEIEVLFTTPPLLNALAQRLSTEQRERIRGIHIGGMRLEAAEYQRLNQDEFPTAVLLPGYGNSLSGVAFEESEAQSGESPIYHIDDPALWLQIIPEFAPGQTPPLTVTQATDTRGRIVLHRLDQSFMIINLLERDLAAYTDAEQNHLRIIGPVEEKVAQIAGNIY